MKNLINVSLIALMISIGSYANAAEKFSVEITNTSIVNVTLSNVTKGQTLVLKDYAGIVLYNTILQPTKNFSKFFDFSDIQNGIYLIETEEEHLIKTTPILKDSKGITIINTSATTFFKPLVKVKESMVDIMLVKTSNKPVSLKIYDSVGILLNSTEEKNEGKFKKSFDFASMPKGVYRIHTGQGDRIITTNISI